MDDKILRIERLETTRDIIVFCNSKKIQKEDIVSILDKGTYYLLVYYGE